MQIKNTESKETMNPIFFVCNIESKRIEEVQCSLFDHMNANDNIIIYIGNLDH